jgi:hypothetical protein
MPNPKPRRWAGLGITLLVLGLVASAGCTRARPPEVVVSASEAERALLSTLRKSHPRLILHADDLARARSMIAQEPLARQWRDRLHGEAMRILGEPPVVRTLIGPRMLAQSRQALDRISILALLYHLEGNRRFAERARQELLAASVFQDWNPSHFLDVAEMAHAVALGYDWLYDVLSGPERTAVRRALITHALKPALERYRGQKEWVTATHNWNLVCNAGMVLVALAIADEERELAAFVLGRALESVKGGVGGFAPDGGWVEGPEYWHYGSRYLVYLLDALETALGTDFGLSRAPGLGETALFRLHFVGPTGLRFNFADAAEREEAAPHLFWLARRFDRPLYAWIERQITVRPQALDLLWFDPRGKGPRADGTPTDMVFKGIHAAFFRSAWEEPNAIFVAMKGGDNRANHSHLDLGTFVMDADGVRWAMDLGPDDYDLPGYFSRQSRYAYYRLKTEGHNTLVLGDQNQNPAARAPILGSSSTRDHAFAVIDLSEGYAGRAEKVWRGLALHGRQHVLVQDEIEAVKPVSVKWGMHTRAEVQLDGRRAILRDGGASLMARIVEPTGASFEVAPATPPSPQNPNTGVRKLIVRLPGPVTRARIVVLLSPLRAPGLPAFLPTITPLSSWVSSARG